MRKSIKQLVAQEEDLRQVNNRDEAGQEHLEELDNSIGAGSFASKLRAGVRGGESAIGNDTEIIFGPELGQDYGKYYDDLDPEQVSMDNLDNLEDMASKNQGGWETAAKFVGRTAITAVAETLKGFGYLAGAVPALITQDITTMTNNFFVEGIESLSEEAKESIPVWVSNDVKNGKLVDKLFSGEMWANEGADGLGFLLSSLGIGGAFNAIGKTGSALSLGLSAGSQTVVEAAAETQGLTKELNNYWQERLQPDGTYLDEKGNTLTKEEVDDIKKNALHSTFLENVTLLALPNIIMTKTIFGKAVADANMIGGREAIKGTTLDEIKNNLVKRGNLLNKSIDYVKNAAKVGASEGFQEWSQFAIEDYSKELGKNLQDKNIVEGLLAAYEDGLTDVDGQLSIALGTIFGAGASVIGSYKQSKADSKKRNELIASIDTVSERYKGNLKSVYKVNEEGKLEIDKAKLKEIFKSNEIDITNELIYKKAREVGNKKAARDVLGMMAINLGYEFFESSDEMKIFDKIIEENNETYENDFKDLGFESKEDMVQFLKESVNKAQRSYQQYKSEGPNAFKLSKKVLRNSTLSTEEQDEVFKDFYNKLVNVAVYNGYIGDRINEKLENVNERILQEKEKIAKTKLEGEDIEELFKHHPLMKPLIAEETRLKKKYKENLEELSKLYDSKSQKEALEILAERKIEEKKAIEKDKVKQEELKQLTQDFYTNLEDKGYSILENPKENDFSREVIALRDENGQVFKVGKRIGKNKKAEFVVKNVETGEVIPFTAQLLEKKFKGADAIMSKEEFTKWRKAKNIIKLNNKKLETLNKLISDNENKTLEAIEEIEKLNEDIKFYSEYIDNLYNNENATSTEALLEQIEEAEQIINEIDTRLNGLNNTVRALEESKDILEDLRTELEVVIENNKTATDLENFSFNKIYQEIKEELDNLKVNTKIDDLDTAVEYANIVIEEWTDVKTELEDLLNDLYLKLADLTTMDSWELLQEYLNATNYTLSDKDLDELFKARLEKEKFSDFERMGIFRRLFANERDRKKIKEAIAKDLKDTNDLIEYTKSELNSINNKIEKAKKKIDDIYKYKKLAKVENLLATSLLNIRREFNLQGAKEAKASKNQNHDRPEQSSTVKSKTALKNTPYSSISSVWETAKGVVNFDNGNNGRTTNYKDAAHWSKAMLSIDNNKIDEYSVKLLNANQLRAEGIEPPSTKDEDVYIVLYHKNQIFKFEGKIPYAGLANSSTYFSRENSKIVLKKGTSQARELQEAKNKKGKEGDDFTYERNGLVYKDIASLEIDLIKELEEEYKAWRADKVKRLAKNESIYLPATNVSPGRPNPSKNKGNLKNKPEKVFGKVKKVIIPEGDTINIGDKSVSVVPGMVYIENEKGQIHRVYNHKIGDLSPAKKAQTINTIVKFIALSHFVEGNMAQEIPIAGFKNQSYPLVGSKNGVGVLDYYINWGKKKGKEWGIFIENNSKTGDKFLIIKDPNNGEDVYINTKELFQGTPSNNSVRTYGDPNIKIITDFLETKYLNVNKKSLNNNNENFTFYMPYDWTIVKEGNDKVVKIKVDKKGSNKTYNDHVLNEVVYSDIEEMNSDKEIPNLTHQYVTFDKNKESNEPVFEEEAEEATQEDAYEEFLKSEESSSKKGKLSKAYKEMKSEPKKKKGNLAKAFDKMQSDAQAFMEATTPPNEPLVSSDGVLNIKVLEREADKNKEEKETNKSCDTKKGVSKKSPLSKKKRKFKN